MRASLREPWWPHADPSSLEVATAELWLDGALRALPPQEAAAAWLECRAERRFKAPV